MGFTMGEYFMRTRDRHQDISRPRCLSTSDNNQSRDQLSMMRPRLAIPVGFVLGLDMSKQEPCLARLVFSRCSLISPLPSLQN
jgi:hypothetical protein